MTCAGVVVWVRRVGCGRSKGWSCYGGGQCSPGAGALRVLRAMQQRARIQVPSPRFPSYQTRSPAFLSPQPPSLNRLTCSTPGPPPHPCATSGATPPPAHRCAPDRGGGVGSADDSTACALILLLDPIAQLLHSPLQSTGHTHTHPPATPSNTPNPQHPQAPPKHPPAQPHSPPPPRRPR